MKIIKIGLSLIEIDRPQGRKWMGVNGTRKSALLNCPFCKTDFILEKGDPYWERADCFDDDGNIVRFFIQCPHCRHKSNHERAVVESNAA